MDRHRQGWVRYHERHCPMNGSGTISVKDGRLPWRSHLGVPRRTSLRRHHRCAVKLLAPPKRLREGAVGRKALLHPYFVVPRSWTSFQFPHFVTPRPGQEYPCVPSVRGSTGYPLGDDNALFVKGRWDEKHAVRHGYLRPSISRTHQRRAHTYARSPFPTHSLRARFVGCQSCGPSSRRAAFRGSLGCQEDHQA